MSRYRVLLLVLLLAGCATSGGFTAERVGLGHQVSETDGIDGYLPNGMWIARWDDINIIVADPDEVRRTCLVLGAREKQGSTVKACYAHLQRLLVTPADFWILMHELKHHFMGAYHP